MRFFYFVCSVVLSTSLLAAPVKTVENRLYMEEGGYKNEVLVNGSTQVVPLAPGTQGTMAFGGGTTIVSWATGYNYSFTPVLQMGLFPSVTYLSGAGSNTIVGLLAGPTVNLSLDGKIQNAFFLSGAMGLVAASDQTEFTFRFDVGKRFYLFDHLSLRPSFGLQKISGSSLLFIFNLLGASVHF